jgi:hypothetical protein
MVSSEVYQPQRPARMAYLRKFIANPIGDAETAVKWLFWHEDHGAYFLAGDHIYGNDRAAALLGTGMEPYSPPQVGGKLQTVDKPRVVISGRLAEDAPQCGPGLLEASIQALENAYQAGPLRVRPDQTPEDFWRVAHAYELLAGRMGSLHRISSLVALYYPEGRVSPNWQQPKLAKLLDMETVPTETRVLNDIANWFKPRSRYGEKTRRDQGELHSHSIYERFPEFAETGAANEEASAHEIIEAAAEIEAFYAKAAEELELNTYDVKLRIAAMTRTSLSDI